MEDKYKKQRRFTEDQIRTMRAMKQEGMTLAKIARFFQVSVVSVYRIVNHINYAHVD